MDNLNLKGSTSFIHPVQNLRQPLAASHFIHALASLAKNWLQFVSLRNEKYLYTEHVRRLISSKDFKTFKACFRRRTFHVPNLMQMSSNKDLRSLTLGSTHEKFGV